MTGTALLQLVDQGRIALSDPVSMHRPEVPNGDAITIEQLLAGPIVEQLTGRKLAADFEEQLFQPLGLTQTELPSPETAPHCGVPRRGGATVTCHMQIRAQGHRLRRGAEAWSRWATRAAPARRRDHRLLEVGHPVRWPKREYWGCGSESVVPELPGPGAIGRPVLSDVRCRAV